MSLSIWWSSNHQLSFDVALVIVCLLAGKVDGRREELAVVPSGLGLDTVLDGLFEKFRVLLVHAGHDGKVTDDTAGQSELVGSESLAGRLDELGDGLVELELDTDGLHGALFDVSTEFTLEGIEKSALVLFHVQLVDLLEVLWWGVGDNLEERLFVGSPPALSGFVKGLAVLLGLLIGVVVLVQFHLRSLQTVEDETLKVSSELTTEIDTKISVIEREVGLTELGNLLVGPSAHDGPDDALLRAEAGHGPAQHHGFRHIQWDSHVLEGQSKVTRSALGLDDGRQILVELGLVAVVDLVTHLGRQSGEGLNETILVCAPALYIYVCV